ncbi:MAG: putative selenate reductase subunit YgfK [Clostridia bacterium]|nr:putative selenate reductase subunit YgfK [Clostridia bacterium]
MSDVMRPMPFGQLMNWALEEYRKNDSLFGVSNPVKHRDGQALPIFDEKIEAPFGPAAGPHTQLAQNIIAAYAAGARFFELKTVQVMDGPELAKCVNKPCITAGDECYNCEWSTELYVTQAFGEYVKAWVACKLLAKEFGLGDPDGFVFNMSVGYDLAGIKSEKINAFIDGMIEAKDTEAFRECIAWARENTGLFTNVDEAYAAGISSRISCSITESTLHGCPPDEIERIATYLITEKHLNTYIKLNPTLLGYEYARNRLDSLGFDYVHFDDRHFREDLQWKDAVPMLERLSALAKGKGLEFGVKLTNTFPVDVTQGELPSEEMYMAGRALFPLTIHLAARISETFGGKLRISWSGGADIHNIADLFKAGIWPITMATAILKPGGYQRMNQIAESFAGCGSEPFRGVDVQAVKALDEGVAETDYYRKPVKPLPDRKTGRALPLFDCFTAPCRDGCPIGQDIPAYLQAMLDEEPEKALRIILERNPLPFITGTICPHHCGDKCMRNYYEETLQIRGTKLEAAMQAFDAVLPSLRAGQAAGGKKVAVVGAGPAGLAAAMFLSRAGVPVTVFERRQAPGGVVAHIIPDFRISMETIEKDIAICKAFGAEIVCGREITSVAALKAEGYTDVIVAVGAWKHGRNPLAEGECLDALTFLEKFKADPASVNAGQNIAVLGGGNTAMDVARAARRLPGSPKVRLVYRRTRRYMPADEEELQMALADGVEFMELLAPEKLKGGQLICHVMELGAPDKSGRRSPVDTGEVRNIPADTVIAAVGERVDTALFESAGCTISEKGLPVVDAGMKTSTEGVYAIGDARRGPATVVEGIADAQAAAAAIAGIRFDGCEAENSAAHESQYLFKKGRVAEDTSALPDWRCLGCPTVCEVCADVCPNRANVAIHVPGKCQAQIIHVDGMCNECGNCAVFCPYSGKPYRDKFTLFWSEEDFADSENEGFLPVGKDSVKLRMDGKVQTVSVSELDRISEDAAGIIRTVISEYGYLIP